jgi:hypothetical protein
MIATEEANKHRHNKLSMLSGNTEAVLVWLRRRGRGRGSSSSNSPPWAMVLRGLPALQLRSPEMLARSARNAGTH